MIEMSECLNTFSHRKIHLDTFGTKLAENNHGKCSYKTEMILWLRGWLWVDFWTQKPGSGDWAKVAAWCANGEDDPSPAKVGGGVYARGYDSCTHAWKSISGIGWAINHPQGSRDFLWVQCKVTPPLVPSPPSERGSPHARRSKVSFTQTSSSIGRSQALVPRFCVFPSLLSNCLTLPSTVCFGTSCPIFLFLSFTGRNLGLQTIPYPLTSPFGSKRCLFCNHLPSFCPVSWKNRNFLPSIYQSSAKYLITLPWLFPSLFCSDWNLPFLRGPCFPGCLLKW